MDSSVVERWIRDRKFLGLSPGRSGGRIFSFRVNCLCLILFPYPFHPCVTSVRSRCFCQKCMLLQMKLHSKLVHRTCVQNVRQDGRRFTWDQPCKNQPAL